ncbi:hypothetical protein HNQ35_000073 [Cerasibacillus quisquiliarum]|uniref:Holin n=1 Tax=Cerasibacillus quisquiliarum TaxID=227865 RepID=A0A511UUH8_9BACI|nr:holin [Cerasibacillus quisquiliarum]MBB5144884.1 hypothetical protein [Cerasibacillus quisquiliarum]GEN30224.1 hypothetical protein CQU01_04620 [Cerasibacillus quisquiliarum]
MVEILAMATAIAAVTSGVVQAIKMTELVDKRYMPLMAIIVGMLLGLLATFMDINLTSRLWAGGISGLASVGLFELGKNTVDKE